jgi:hypothetical protein
MSINHYLGVVAGIKPAIYIDISVCLSRFKSYNRHYVKIGVHVAFHLELAQDIKPL